MKIVYSCFTTLGAGGLGLVSFETVRAIYHRQALQRGIFYGNKQSEIPKDYLRIIRLQPFQIFSSLPARYYYPLKRIYLDWVTSRIVRREGCDVFHGWTTESLQSLKAAQDVGAIGFVERPAPHPRFSQALMDEEYELQGVSRPGRSVPRFLTRIEASHRDRTVAVEEFALANRIIVQSEFCRESFLKEGIPKEKLVVIPRAVDTDRFVPGPESDEPFRVLFVGQLCFRKGVHYLLEAWDRLKLDRAELWLVGNVHDEVRRLLGRYASRSSIRVFGHAPDPTKLFQQASVFVLPSIVEGSAKVTYEAMACGVPVVVTPNAGSVARDGEEGYIVPVRDTVALADRIQRLYEDRDHRRTMGLKARRLMTTHTWSDFRRRMFSAYEEAVANRNDRDPAHPRGSGRAST